MALCKRGDRMAFSKGKRIEDETSQRIIDLAVNIGCKEGPDALTVTRICRELNCDRRVIYNRFRDVDEINLIVAGRCNEELLKNARAALKPDASYYENLLSLIQAEFTYIYEKNTFFQYYTALYQVDEDGIHNEILQNLEEYIEKGKESGEFNIQTGSREAAEGIWIILTGICRMLAANVNYKYQDGYKALMYGIHAICHEMNAS